MVGNVRVCVFDVLLAAECGNRMVIGLGVLHVWSCCCRFGSVGEHARIYEEHARVLKKHARVV